MSDVIDFASARNQRNAEDESAVTPESVISGPAKCLACGHEWFAENVPTGDGLFDLACPSCDMRRGQMQYPPVLAEGMLRWTHKCGGQHFSATYVQADGFVLNGDEDLRKMNTSDGAAGRLTFFCHGCGELVPLEDMR